MSIVPEVVSLGAARLPVDGHVHFHDLSLVESILDVAASNFRSAGQRTDGLLGMLLMTQSANEDVFEALKDLRSAGRWSITPIANERETLLVRSGDSVIAIVCGRQVRAEDGLEVLALGTCQVFQDGVSFCEAVEAVSRTTAIPVIPWGLGKFMGARGERVAELLASRRSDSLFVGDNGSRLDMLGTPAWLHRAQLLGFRVLPGTDPFPIGGDYQRTGSFGFLVDVQPEITAPWQSLRRWLLERPVSPARYGRACTPGHFLRIQAGIQLHKRLGRRPTE